jgi:hypothetical protein
MNCKLLSSAMAKRAIWTSPGGKTHYATLNTSREIAPNGKESRFVPRTAWD